MHRYIVVLSIVDIVCLAFIHCTYMLPPSPLCNFGRHPLKLNIHRWNENTSPFLLKPSRSNRLDVDKVSSASLWKRNLKVSNKNKSRNDKEIRKDSLINSRHYSVAAEFIKIKMKYRIEMYEIKIYNNLDQFVLSLEFLRYYIWKVVRLKALVLDPRFRFSLNQYLAHIFSQDPGTVRQKSECNYL